MFKKLFPFFILSAVVLLSGCASKETKMANCAKTDWSKEGYSHSSKGEETDLDDVNECLALGSSQNIKDAYASGYADGLMKFCTQEFGLYWGRAGKSYDRICPAKLENNFLAGYSKGKLEYDQIQIQQQNSASLKKISEQGLIINAGSVFPPPKACFSSFDCKVEDKCIQNPKSNFGTDRVCQQRPYKDCFSDWDCEIKADCKDRLCDYKK